MERVGDEPVRRVDGGRDHEADLAHDLLVGDVLARVAGAGEFADDGLVGGRQLGVDDRQDDLFQGGVGGLGREQALGRGGVEVVDDRVRQTVEVAMAGRGDADDVGHDA